MGCVSIASFLEMIVFLSFVKIDIHVVFNDEITMVDLLRHFGYAYNAVWLQNIKL